MPAYRDPITNKFAKRPSPVTVAAQINRAQLDARYVAQVQRARAESQRRASARKAGYRGALTRAELSAMGYRPTTR